MWANNWNEKLIFPYLSTNERALRCSLLENKFHILEERYKYSVKFWEDISATVARVLDGDELVFYQAFCKQRDIPKTSLTGPFSEQEMWFSRVDIPRMERLEYRDWLGEVTHIDFVPSEEADLCDFTEDEIEGFLRDQEEDEIPERMYEDDYRERTIADENLSRWKPSRIPNQDKDLKKEYYVLARLEQTILRRIAFFKKRVTHLNKNRKTPLPIEYPDYRNINILLWQLQKTWKQIIKLKLRIFSAETRRLIDGILETDWKIVSDIMSRHLVDIAWKMREKEGINGHPNPHHRLLWVEGKKKNYKRKRCEAVKMALDDTVSYSNNEY